ncbi:MAG: CBS domain-containing protein [Sulfurifustaceae bacterium]
MPIGEVCVRDVVFTEREMSLREAAKLMRQHHVGDLIVAEKRDGRCFPVGIVTDRDIVMEVIAKDLSVDDFAVGDVIGPKLITTREGDGIFETIQSMRTNGVRRLPVVNDDGVLIGIVSMDDMLELLAEELTGLARIPARERQTEIGTRP